MGAAAAATCIFYNLRFSNTDKRYETTKTITHLSFLPTLCPTVSSRAAANLQLKRVTACSLPSAPHSHGPCQQLAVLLEVEGKSSGDEERMLILFFNRIGWPTSLPTSEKGTFMKSVLREKKNALEEFVMAKSLPLRPGVEDFIDDACNEGIPVVILKAYCKNGDKIARSIIEKLGKERLSKTKIVGNEEVEQSLYGQLVLGKGMSSGLDEQLAMEAKKAASAEKQRIAKEVASVLKLSVDIDTSSTESSQKIVAALRAGAELAEVPVFNCVLIAGSQSGLAGAQRVGMPCIVVRSSSTSRAEFPSASAVMDGFGGADLTISKLHQKRWS
ncbi:uncharacterized protein LOC131160220 isoform X2 [Malania oleifera]|uniref:uncharacterized protein LOC131160220 isoform X2 n=1 Tax=Malania oleifera TaxID=397392 RepID=UPI0025ADD7E9|nr:uncharacterized protein LOC131160220 isoform X2 [Malania oleifera]